MHIIWENMTATLILMGIALTMVVVNERNQRTLTESTAYYALKKQGLAFTEVLKRDLQGVEEVFMHAEEDSVFQFSTRIGQDTTLQEVKYQRRKTGSRLMTVTNEQGAQVNEIVAFYEIQRFTRPAYGTSTWTRSGGSMEYLTEWEIQALNEENVPLEGTDPLANCRRVGVSFAAASPYLETETVDQMRWETVFVPPLRRRSQVL